MKDIMLDLETLGTQPGSAIVSIGAVYFDLNTGELGETFYRVVDIRSEGPPFKVGMDTVCWWMQQENAARAVFDTKAAGVGPPSVRIVQALTEFAEFANKDDTRKTLIWGNGASFDNVVLTEAYRIVGIPCPWPYYNDRCYRTVRAHYKSMGIDPPLVREGTFHNALDDAITQVKHLIKIVHMDKLSRMKLP